MRPDQEELYETARAALVKMADSLTPVERSALEHLTGIHVTGSQATAGAQGAHHAIRQSTEEEIASASRNYRP